MDEYQKQALQSVAITDKGVPALAHRTLGLTGEAGIVANQMKKIIRDKNGQPDDADKELALEKLGDVLYYVAVLSEYFDLNLSDVAKANVQKSVAFKASRTTS